MQPYQRASQSLQNQGAMPFKIAGQVASVAASLGAASAGASVLGKALPFLNKYIPRNLAVQGLNKIDPRFGKFIDEIEQNGYSFEDAREYIKSKLEKEINPEQPQVIEEPQIQEEQQNISDKESKDDSKNILMKFSPRLAQEVENYIKSGHPIEEIEKIVRSPGSKLAKNVDYIEQSLGMTFYDILRSIYGGAKRSSKQPIESVQSSPIQEQQVAPQVSQQPGQGQKAILEAILASKEMRRKRNV